MISPNLFGLAAVDHETVVVPAGAAATVKPTKGGGSVRCGGVYVGTAGHVLVTLMGAPDNAGGAPSSSAKLYKNVASGSFLRGDIIAIGSTADGNTATDMLFVYYGI